MSAVRLLNLHYLDEHFLRRIRAWWPDDYLVISDD
jgi:hypothetical protein